MIYHPLLALSKIKGLTEVIIIGFYEDALLADFIKSARREFSGLSIT
jgi:mannose-1-phosphate guanylyltransferase